MVQGNQQKFYLPSTANHVSRWVKEFQSRVQKKRINNSRITPEIISIPQRDLGPEDVMQIDQLPERQTSVGYKNFITSTEVFSQYALAYPISNPTAINTAKAILDILIRHAYVPTLTITEKKSAFVSNIIHEKADVLGITTGHAATKHAQTIAVLETINATIKTSTKMSSGDFCKH